MFFSFRLEEKRSEIDQGSEQWGSTVKPAGAKLAPTTSAKLQNEIRGRRQNDSPEKSLKNG
jgi:hypothetical protein